MLAGLAGDLWEAGLDRLSDDELVGVLGAARRLSSWAAGMELAAVADLWRRRVDEEAAGDTGAAEHTDDELAAALTLTGRAANQVLDLAIALQRLPLTSAALAAGDIDLPKARVITNEFTGLTDAHAAAAERAIIVAAAGQTTSQLGHAARRAVIAADPSAARKRKEQALREARVERCTEHAGTAALAGRDLPPLSVLAADQNLTALAQQLKDAGADGTMDILRASVYLALLSGTPFSQLLPAAPAGSGDRTGHGPAAAPGLTGTGGPSAGGPPGVEPVTLRAGGAKGAVNLTMPLATWLGKTQAPGHVAGFGPLDASDSLSLAHALAARPDTKWCITLTDPEGRPLAHGCTRGAPPTTEPPPGAAPPAGPPPGGPLTGGPPPSGPPPAGPPPAGPPTGGPPTGGPPTGGPSTDPPPTSPPPTGSSHTKAQPKGSPPTGSRPTGSRHAGSRHAGSQRARPQRAGMSGARTSNGRQFWAMTLTWLGGGCCDHSAQTPAYSPSPTLRHLVQVRQPTCSFPGCGRPGIRTDLDHTVPYDRGGRTCMCNLGPLCRYHHQLKQSRGWTLDQASPGIMIWTTPSGRRYTVQHRYPA